MSSKNPHPDDFRIAAEAARWQHALDSGDAAQREQFSAWVKTSPRHLEEFLFMEALEAATDNIDPQRKIKLPIDAAASMNVVALRAGLHEPAIRVHAPAARRRARWPWAVAAAVALLALPMGLKMLNGWEHYSTAIGEQRAVELADGSVIQLNTQSTVLVRFSDEGREVRLADGEALFKVARDAKRPFRVDTGDAVIRVVGTQFNVSRRGSGTQVAVLEGRVQVEKDHAPQMLAAGEGARITHGGHLTREALNLAEVATWRQRRLVFREETLANIAAEFNRYNRTPQIVIEGRSASETRYGGTFDADDPQSLADFVETRGHLSITRSADRILIRSPNP